MGLQMESALAARLAMRMEHMWAEKMEDSSDALMAFHEAALTAAMLDFLMELKKDVTRAAAMDEPQVEELGY
jgi:hypothetical protein